MNVSEPKTLGAAPSTSRPPEKAGDGVPQPPAWGSFWFYTAAPSWLTSSLLHAAILLLLALLTIPQPDTRRPKNVLVLDQTREMPEDLSEFRAEDVSQLSVDPALAEPAATVESDMPPLGELSSRATDELTTVPTPLEIDPLGLEAMLSHDLSQVAGDGLGVALQGRSKAARQRMLKEGGGTAGSEAAVVSALDWIARHQNPDGSWSLDHRLSPQCRAQCGNPGDNPRPAPFGATGLALMPFLGAGHTHQEGAHKKTVDLGLAFLLRNMRTEGNRGLLTDEGGTYYSHAICAIALCEAYALTKDSRLGVAAQLVVNEIVDAQDPLGGGWRYESRQAGDTSAFGWCFMALKSAHMAGLVVPPPTVQKASFFLDTVAAEDGHRYRYLVVPDHDGPIDPTVPRRFVYRSSTSAIGLLSRMYLGWSHEEPRLAAGVEYLSRKGPSIAGEEPDLYFDYYATQVLRHYGGEPWEKWNLAIRDRLISLQSKTGHEQGSWYIDRSFMKNGGRLFCTSLATMILEVYYRYLPIYQTLTAEDEFPL